MPVQTTAASISTEMYIYCHCKEDKGGEMVGCDNKDWEHGQWCLKMKNPPRTSKWYCPDCRKLGEKNRENIFLSTLLMSAHAKYCFCVYV